MQGKFELALQTFDPSFKVVNKIMMHVRPLNVLKKQIAPKASVATHKIEC